MFRQRNPYSARHVKRTSRQVSASAVGSHVVRSQTGAVRRAPSRAESVRRRARARRIVTGVVAVLVVLAVALAAGLLAFRGVVGSQTALKESDAEDALVAVRAGQPSYTLISAELGALAAPLDNSGPDVLLLAYVVPGEKKLSLVNIPPNLPVEVENKTVMLADAAERGDAALVRAVSAFAKVDVSHYVKVPEGAVARMVDALGGIEVELEQVIDDPRAGDVYLAEGPCVLRGANVETYLRAENLKMGVQDKMAHQLALASRIVERVFAGTGGFTARLESIGSCFQTDYALSDLEAVNASLSGIAAADIACVSLPGYNTQVTAVSESGAASFVGSASDMADIVKALEAGQEPRAMRADQVQAADPASFTVEVQNGTAIAGAAGVTGEALSARGFQVVSVGNAEQQVYDETLVVYKGDGLSRARAVIDALGMGREVSGDAYYRFDADVLLVIGADYKPAS